jgi:hypothetical protein
LNISIPWPVGVCCRYLLEHLGIKLLHIIPCRFFRSHHGLSYMQLETFDWLDTWEVKHLPLCISGSLLTFPYLEYMVYTDWLFVEGSVEYSFVYKTEFPNTTSTALIPELYTIYQALLFIQQQFQQCYSFAQTP